MARTAKPEVTSEDIAADVDLLVAHGIDQAEAEAMTPEDRAALVADLPEVVAETASAPSEDEPAAAETPDAEVHAEPEAAEEPEAEAAETLEGAVLNMVAEIEAAPFNAGVQHQLELKWAEFTAFAKTVEHTVEGELGDIVGWIKARF